MTFFVPPWVASRATLVQLEAPIQGSGLVPRTRLLERLALVADDVPLVVFTAPAGYGKTTALTQWAAADGRRFGWVTLSDVDSDPVRLAGHVAFALTRLMGLDPAVLGPVAAGNGSPHLAVARLLTSLRRRSPRAVLVLDDVHEVRDVEALRFIAALSVGVPPGFHVAIGSRVSVARGPLAGVGRSVEFGADDLAFTDDEAREVLAGVGVVCSDQEIAALVRRTRGWPAAVYLSALLARATPGDEVKVQLRAAGWDEQAGRVTDAEVYAIDGRRPAAFPASFAAAAGDPPINGAMTLTTAEMRVLQLMPTYLSLGEIGERLHISRNTVKSQVAAIYRKLNCSTRAEVVRRGRDLGLLEP